MIPATLTAYAAENVTPKRLSLLVLVDDPTEAELIAVWWRLDRPGRLRCSEHSWATAEPCEHMIAATPVLLRHVLGDNARELLRPHAPGPTGAQ